MRKPTLLAAKIMSLLMLPTSIQAQPIRDADGVYEESGFRLPLPRREMFDAEGRRAFDLVAGRAAGKASYGVGLKGPSGIALHSPRLARLGNEVKWYFRFGSGFDGRTRELVILVAAREFDNQFEWTVHETTAVKEGLEARVIDVIRNRADTSGLDDRDAAIIELGREAITDRSVSRETFERASKHFTPRELVDVVALMGDYVSIAIGLNTFGMKLPPERKPTLPPRNNTEGRSARLDLSGP